MGAKYTIDQIREKLDIICDRIGLGESMRSVLKDSGMPSSKTFYDWLDADENNLKQYARACDKRADSVFEEIIEIADNSGNDKIDLGDGVFGVNHEAIQRDRLRVDARKWAVSKMNPKKYGDKLDIGGDINIHKFDVGFGENEDKV